MKKVAVVFLKPGMVFTAPVYIEDNNILVPAGIPIRQKDIDKLAAWGIASVTTEGEARIPSSGPAPAATGSSARFGPARPPASAPGEVKKSPSALSLTEVQENKGVYRSYMTMIERMNAVFLSTAGGFTIESPAIDNICSQLLQGIRDHRERFIGFILGGEVNGYEMAKNSINTAILSALIAQELRLPHHRIMQIVTGALLHDAGMLRLPRDILDKRGGLSEAERQRMRNHPLLTHKIVTKELSYPEEVGQIVLQHHERWDGEGYPHHIAGDNIDVGARIVSIADAFEAMVSQKPYRNSMVGYQAMKNILADNSRRFDPEILKSFILTMGVYPIGSIVRLNNGTIARVNEVRASAPLRPKIQILIDEYKKVFRHEEGNIIDLLVEKNLYITKAMDAKELSEKMHENRE
jgi:HD-GYP domain-containing protein (c-di-GMP phosphodiesterase class II)